MKRSRLAALLLLSAGLCACAWLPHFHHRRLAHVTPIMTPTATPIAPTADAEDRLYHDATKAIEQRDYGSALDLLQAARDRKADDVRVINAFGVVYDKLGRFDLSTRYYTQAQALDPASPIVRQNLAYSALLQGKGSGGSPQPPALALATPELAPSAQGGLIQVAPGVVRIQVAAAPSTPLRVLTGRPLAIVDASGRPGVAEPVRLELARMGWTVPNAFGGSPPQVQLRTEIVYAPEAQPAAQALARTLPRGVRLAACDDGCKGVRLILGADAAAWKAAGRRGGAHRTL